MRAIFGLILILFLLQGCEIKKESLSTSQMAQMTDGITLHDIWALKKIEQKKYKKTFRQIYLEFNIKEKTFYGNDGCNQILGRLEKVTKTQLIFGLVSGTLMACENMNTSEKFTQTLEQVRFYRVENLHLYLLDKNKKELLNFLKVD